MVRKYPVSMRGVIGTQSIWSSENGAVALEVLEEKKGVPETGQRKDK